MRTIATLSHLAGKRLDLDIDTTYIDINLRTFCVSGVMPTGLIPQLGLQFIQTIKGSVGLQILEWEENWLSYVKQQQKKVLCYIFPNAVIANCST